MSKNDSLDLHVVSSTHWDREWYQTFQEFRVQLVQLWDTLLEELDKDPKFWRFMMDGQTVVVEDYLEIRPDQEDKVRKYVQGGQIELGPWYVLADEWLCSPESHIRNMQIGMSIARKFGKEMRIGYLPDEFGHISQMPQILDGFGIDKTFFSRASMARDISTQLWWKGADGTKVKAHSQSYGNAGRAFRVDNHIEEIDKQVEQLKPLTTASHLLMINGGDHRQPLPQLSDLIKQYNAATPHKMAHTTFGDFFAAIEKDAWNGVPEINGELRDGMVLTGGSVSLYNCWSSRIFNKQMNQTCNDALENWAEPFTGIAALNGEKHPSPLLWQAWKYLIQNYAHDSICGCSIDRVHDQMMTRFEWAQEIADKLTGNAFGSTSSRIDTGKIPESAPVFTTWNPSTKTRAGLVEVVFDTPEKGWDKRAPVSVIDAKGRKIPAQRVPASVGEELGTTRFVLQSEMRVRPDAITFWADDLPAMGYRAYGIVAEEAKSDSTLKTGKTWAENEFIRIDFAANGSFTLKDKTSGATFANLGMIEDGGDCGGGYHYQAPAKDAIYTSKDAKAKIELVESGPALARFRVEVNMRIPQRLNSRRTARISKLAALKVVSFVTIGAGSKSVKLRTQVWNNSVDHRLRVMFPTNLKTDFAQVDGHFDVVDRAIALGENKPWPTEHQRRWVDVSDGTTGLAVMNHGLPEYEVAEDKSRTIFQTLFRSNTYVTKPWWATLVSPQAELLGKTEYDYAVYVHAGDWLKGQVPAEAETAMLPVRAYQFNLPHAPIEAKEQPAEKSYVAVDSPAAITSIVKKADKRNSLVLRLYNPSKSQTDAMVTTWKPIKEAHSLDLEEQRTGDLPVTGGKLKLKVGAKKIVTVEIVV